MSTAAVAKLLGVSRRTIMRWVDQIGMELEKNELGHYQFTDEDIERLRLIHAQGLSITQDQRTSQSIRKGTKQEKSPQETNTVNELNQRVGELERKLKSKADDVVSYQMLLHRREMEELVNKIRVLEEKVTELEKAQEARDHKREGVYILDEPIQTHRTKRKNLLSTIFSL